MSCPVVLRELVLPPGWTIRAVKKQHVSAPAFKWAVLDGLREERGRVSTCYLCVDWRIPGLFPFSEWGSVQVTTRGRRTAKAELRETIRVVSWHLAVADALGAVARAYRQWRGHRAVPGSILTAAVREHREHRRALLRQAAGEGCRIARCHRPAGDSGFCRDHHPRRCIGTVQDGANHRLREDMRCRTLAHRPGGFCWRHRAQARVTLAIGGGR